MPNIYAKETLAVRTTTRTTMLKPSQENRIYSRFCRSPKSKNAIVDDIIARLHCRCISKIHFFSPMATKSCRTYFQIGV